MNPDEPEVRMGDDPDDDAAAFDDLDEVDWDGAAEVQRQIDEINAVRDTDQRKAMAKAWAAELEGR